MRKSIALALLLMIPAAALAAAEAETTRWNDTIRDVYIDGKLDRSPQLLANEKRLVLLPPDGDALLFDTAANEVSRVDRNAFTVADDHTSATTPRTLARTRLAPLTPASENTFVANVDGRTYLIYPHQSHVGPMTEEELWQTAPTWRAIYDHYTPETEAVERLRAIRQRTDLEIVFATWCGDSKRHVPRLLKAVHEAANPNVVVRLFGVGNDFKQPMTFIQDQRIINVPIVVLSRGGKEVARFIETPCTTSIENDVAALASGERLHHPGRYERKELLCSGTYRIEDAKGVAEGTESFEIYRSPDGGLLVHDVINRGEKGSTETWAGLDEHHAPDFAEVTERQGEHVTRARYFADHGKWTVTSRGDEGGIVQQTMTAPPAFVLPATPTLGWLLYSTKREWRAQNVDAYVVDASAPNAVGKMETLRITESASQPFRLLGRLEDRESGLSHGRGQKYDIAGDRKLSLSVTSELNVPLEVELADGSRRRSTQLDLHLPDFVPVSR